MSSVCRPYCPRRILRQERRATRHAIIAEFCQTVEAQLLAAARQAGLAPAELARQLVTVHLPPVPADRPERTSRSQSHKLLHLLMIPFITINMLNNNQNRINGFQRGAECAIANGVGKQLITPYWSC
jgi:hypothetical protein